MSGIYLHIPFCKQACHYCDFHFSTSLKKKEKMIAAMVKELEIRNRELESEVVETIYFGGGTPSLLTIDELQRLLDTIYKNYQVSESPEITLEANPDDLSEHLILQLSKSPINRLSIGIQSFFEEDLQKMHRAHSSDEAKNCLSMATRHFDNITIDLMYGIPNMSNKRWKENLQIAFGFGVNHISSYALTVEPKTALASFIKQGKYPNVDEELAREHFDILVSETEKQGFVQYEISNFGKPTYFSKHNTSYWLSKTYLGIGPSAHSFNKTHRSWNVANNTIYIKALQENTLPSETEELTLKDRFNEYVMTGLRTIWGISLNRVEQEFGIKCREQLVASAEKFIKQGLLLIEKNTTEQRQHLKTTSKGKFLADGLASELFILN
ncbi:MAG: radical SAM family heme chaperone HemW [Polaribacter sp.]|nr:radical SAM family heme chaperone HemW [Polaribacter sp.]